MTRAKARTFLTAAALVLIGAVAFVLYRRGGEAVLDPASAEYEQFVRSFYRGLAHVDVGLLDEADRAFVDATTLAPGEPAAWANLGLTRLRLGEFDEAASPVARAAALAPGNARIAYLQGRMAALEGRLDEAMTHLRRAVELDPDDLHARFALIEELERSGTDGANDEAEAVLAALLARAPDNLALRLESVRLAAVRGDVDSLRNAVAALDGRRSTWPTEIAEHYDELQTAANAGDVGGAARAVTFLRNVLVATPAFQEDRSLLTMPIELVAEPFDRFLTLPEPIAAPSPPDEALAFAREPLGADAIATTALATSLDGTSAPTVFAGDGTDVWRIDGAGGSPLPADRSGRARSASLLALDWNHDFLMDLVTTGPDGLRLLVQADDGSFSDATATASGGSTAPASGATGAWAVDLEMDGDLDIVVGRTGAAPMVLRNNGDGTWGVLEPFDRPVGLRGFAWGDIDRDGDPDAALVGADGMLHVYVNRQGGRFERAAGLENFPSTLDVALADIDADGGLDLVTLGGDRTIRRLSSRDGGWQAAPLLTWDDAPIDAVRGTHLFVADLDNNGALDLVASAASHTAVWLGGTTGAFSLLTRLPDVEVLDVDDLDDDGYLDLTALSHGQVVRLRGQGAQPYHWQVIHTRALAVAGDQRINSFGAGGEIEVRSGLLTQKQVLTGGPAHVGLGARERVDVVRILWPNGVVQAEFDPAPDQVIVAEQRLKGSCPWVFTYDGDGMRFITDFLWRSPLGLRINAQDTAGVAQTEDWIRIGGDQLVPHDGIYDVRITAELWETHYIDSVHLMAVDHPDSVEVFVDERFSPQATALGLHAMTSLTPVADAHDDKGLDVTDLVARLDGRYLATFERGPYQGIARDHSVEFEVPHDGLLGRWLVAQGWVYPTDSSINVAVGQGRHEAPRGLALEAQDAAGHWTVVAPDLGFPAGKNKTMLIDLGAVARAGIDDARRLRLSTNLEVYWDRLAFAARASATPIETTRIVPAGAELAYRGFSRTTYTRDEPETPDYDRIANVTPRWRDLTGLYTRFGDVRELVGTVDDRYVIMNAGDELRLQFGALEPPTAGWRRDFVLVGDGWNKDGDYNTSYSQTVSPLPRHDQAAYESASRTPWLSVDPVFRRHQHDWEQYHTRVVTPYRFLKGLYR